MILEGEDSKGEKVPGAELGFFTSPVYLGDGEVLKVYHGSMSRSEGLALTRAHTRYVERLAGAGIKLPRTIGRARKGADGNYFFQIEQDRFEADELGGEKLKSGNREEVVALTMEIVRDAVTFLNTFPDESIGFHPTFRNYAFRGNDAYYLDTFPPYGSRQDTKAMLLRHAPLSPERLEQLAPSLDKFVAEYYEAPLMIGGAVGTAVRMHPNYEKEIKINVAKYVGDNLLRDVEGTMSAIFKTQEQEYHFLLLQSVMAARPKSSHQPSQQSELPLRAK